MDADFVIVHSDGEIRSHIARLNWSTLAEEHGSIEANARLISCAPEMLEALTRLLLEVESICAHEAGATRDELLERLHMDWDGRMRAARMVISKAKGERG